MRLMRRGPGQKADQPEVTPFSHLVGRADESRDAGRYEQAAVLYAEAVRLEPRRADLLVQQGHMLKEAGQLVGAGEAYSQALDQLPHDADLALQLGHFHKLAGRLAAATAEYKRALELKPGWREPARHLGDLARAGWVDAVPNSDGAAKAPPRLAVPAIAPSELARLVPDLAPRPRDRILVDHREKLHVRRFGRHEHGFWGNARTLRGVEAVRGFCLCEQPVVEVQLLLNGLLMHRGPLLGGYELVHARQPGRLLKYVFNIWLDFGALAPGRYHAEIRCRDVEDRVFDFRDDVVIAAPLEVEDAPDSDALVPLSNPDPAALEAEIRALPSMVRPARRALFQPLPRSVLVMRTDQLGDVISSMAAMRRLRALLPDARIVGLLTAANADLARTLGLYDEIIVIDFADDAFERRRVMPIAAQEALRQRLEPYGFELAIDLSQSDVSRPLLLLSGAPFLYGVGGGDWPWLTAEFGLNTHDRLNRLDRVAHSAKTLALIETLGALLHSGFETVRREDLERERLGRLGIAPDARYVVLHMGARIGFSRWPHFAELARLVLARTDWTVVMMTEDAAVRAALPAGMVDDARFRLLDQRLAFDDFDAIVSFCDVLVGNDSGPKHLASLRGVHTVTLFTARINWVEWAQEEVGTVISRRVPCAGCALFHDPEECGKGFSCIRDIRPEEVFAAMRSPSIDAAAIAE